MNTKITDKLIEKCQSGGVQNCEKCKCTEEECLRCLLDELEVEEEGIY